MPDLNLEPSPDPKDYPYFLGDLHCHITTTNPEAQIWFNYGLTWTCSFNHDEAVVCFENALKADPQCAMAHWGIAYAIGPNYNMPWDGENKSRVHDISKRANEHLDAANPTTPLEEALIGALRTRFNGDVRSRNQAYADAMSAVRQRFPDHLEVGVLCIDAKMNISPWKLWHVWTLEPAAQTLECKLALEQILMRHPTHPGAVHLYIHLMEMSPTPEVALEPSKDLHLLVPDSGHLRHMASHIFLLCGRWDDAILANTEAVRVDNKYLDRAGAVRFYALYRAHNWHFLIFAAMQSGKKTVALEAVQGLEDSIPDAFLQQMPDMIESLYGIRSHVLVRFGMWQEILDTPLKDDDFWSYTNAMLHFAKGTALAALGRLEEAEHERTLITVKPSRMMFKNTCTSILEVARAMLDGEIEYRRHRTFGNLRRSVDLCDHLEYTEPWGWMHPPRHALGALLLESDKVEEALEVYELDLGMRDLPRALCNCKNVWALHGYVECLKRLGRDRTQAEHDLSQALQSTDVIVRSSCACRRRRPNEML